VSHRTDAELLAAHVLGTSRGRLLLHDTWTDDSAATFESLVARRAGREPLQHLIGTVWFAGVELAVGPGVFVPRPETELLVAWALTQPLPPAPTILDLCSGTGAIALAVAHARPDADVIAVERDPVALAWLRRNASDRAGAGDRPIRIVAGDATDPAVTATRNGSVDLVLSNPPYVPDDTPVPAEVADHDPAAAVFAGPDGLAVIRPVIARAAALVRRGGWIGIEHDESHGAAVAVRLDAAAFNAPTLHRDLAGRPRFTTARHR
jgi:release factor glutamine methyltransferase